MTCLSAITEGSQDAPAIIFLHGFMGSARDWAEITASLRGAWRCVAFDLPGHGSSPPFTHEHERLDAIGALVIKNIDALALSTAPVVVGYSMGARVAMALASRHPVCCRAVVLESGHPGLVDDTRRRERAQMDRRRAARLRTSPLADFLDDWYRAPLFESLRRDRERFFSLEQARRANDSVELARVIEALSPGRQAPMWSWLDDIRAPTLLIAGALDQKYVEVSARMQKKISGARRWIAPEAGHNVHFEAPTAFVDRLSKFLGAL